MIIIFSLRGKISCYMPNNYTVYYRFVYTQVINTWLNVLLLRVMIFNWEKLSLVNRYMCCVNIVDMYTVCSGYVKNQQCLMPELNFYWKFTGVENKNANQNLTEKCSLPYLIFNYLFCSPILMYPINLQETLLNSFIGKFIWK